MSPSRVLVALTLSAALQPAWSETVYRCPGGYSQSPCAGGTALEAADGRSREQRSQSAAVARRDAQLADRLQRERLEQEAQPPSAYIPAAGRAAEAAASAPAAAKRKTSSTEAQRGRAVFRATAPGEASAKKKPSAKTSAKTEAAQQRAPAGRP